MNTLFKVSAKNHAGMILISILAEEGLSEDYVSLKDIADKMHLSKKFLEEIAAALKKAGLVSGRKGPGGGYKLAKDPKDISAYEILTALEGQFVTVSCEGGLCPVAEHCASKKLWGFLFRDLIESLKKTSLHQISGLN